MGKKKGLKKEGGEKRHILEEMNIFYAHFISFIHQLFKEPFVHYEK